MIACC